MEHERRELVSLIARESRSMASSALARTHTGTSALHRQRHALVDMILPLVHFAEATQAHKGWLEFHLLSADALGRSCAKRSKVADVVGRARRRTSESVRRACCSETMDKARKHFDDEHGCGWVHCTWVHKGDLLPNGSPSKTGQFVIELKLAVILRELRRLQREYLRRIRQLDERDWIDPRALTAGCAPPVEAADQWMLENEEEPPMMQEHDEEPQEDRAGSGLKSHPHLSGLPEGDPKGLPSGETSFAPAAPASVASETPSELVAGPPRLLAHVPLRDLTAAPSNDADAPARPVAPPERAPRAGEQATGHASPRIVLPASMLTPELVELARTEVTPMPPETLQFLEQLAPRTRFEALAAERRELDRQRDLAEQLEARKLRVSIDPRPKPPKLDGDQ